MTRTDPEKVLTPAARQLLDELLSDVRTQLVLGAQDIAAEATADVREISVSDLAKSYAKLQQQRAQKRLTSVDRALTLYMATGIVVTLGGATAYVVQRSSLSSGTMDFPLLISLTGALIATFAFFLQTVRRTEQLRGRVSASVSVIAPSEAYGAFLGAWRNIELALRYLATQTMGESATNVSLSKLLLVLRDKEILDPTLLRRLRELLDIRNRVAHHGGTFSSEEIKKYTVQADEVFDALDRKAAALTPN